MLKDEISILSLSILSIPVYVSFCPVSDKEVNFNVQCVMKKKTSPLTLNIKAEGYSMNCLVLCEDSSGNKVELASNSLNSINFGEVSDENYEII